MKTLALLFAVFLALPQAWAEGGNPDLDKHMGKMFVSLKCLKKWNRLLCAKEPKDEVARFREHAEASRQILLSIIPAERADGLNSKFEMLNSALDLFLQGVTENDASKKEAALLDIDTAMEAGHVFCQKFMAGMKPDLPAN